MKSRSFTLIELIFVIVISSLLGIAVMNFPDNSLSLARDQLMKDIRLTQTLALLDDKYLDRNTTSDLKNINRSKFWFKSFWQVQIQTSYQNIYYSIYSEEPAKSGKYSFIPAQSEVSLNSLTQKYMSGKWSESNKNEYSTNLNLTLEYEITSIQYFFIASKHNGKENKLNIIFDNFGRPYILESINGITQSSLQTYATLHPFKYLLQEPVQIKIVRENDETCFNLEPISGYIHIKNCIF